MAATGPATPLPAAEGAVVIAGLTADSRAVMPGYLFAALPGAKADGRAFIGDAVARGAAAVLAPPGTAWPPAVPPRPMIEDVDPRRRLALMAAAFHGAQPRSIAAITGTNGKTSTADFLRQIWAGLHQGRAASLGTLGLVAPGEPGGPGLTTPDPVALAATLARLARSGIDHAAIEASSHGLDQRRLDGVRLAAGAFTTFTRDHLDYHGGMAAYLDAKLRLFDTLLPPGAAAVAHTALPAEALARLRAIAAERGLRLMTVGDAGATIAIERTEARADGQAITLTHAGTRRDVLLPLVGFQGANALVAAMLAIATGAEADAVFALLPSLAGVRGRIERVAVLGSGAAIYVDYAHTPDAITTVLSALRPHVAGRLAIVVGAGGDRDPGKRPLMGEAAARGADSVTITDDNPRSEDPATIRAAVLAGARAIMPEAVEIGGRDAAIATAIASLGPGDVLVIAGKGHEQGQEIAGRIIPFDDATVARQAAGARE
ncbi:UDP-N-acetylmuramoyl-L-alanyl-D-glutamate--2,6-diaminopimelate ligase [Elioraea sp.]|uniref:UDP-N-acetylmuramoyl-L-alanyl-D-glutamate--2, 6-diaminopimelate ligase n=1 Tax=Elioraea sp. TaxID=2185103 RepID=UPI0025B9C93F|nr:UDP-N-acetylmuramoyl-L-alanyl-D-glutamate--2,6-diaminopimelate ligase [Elioraea sp.]